MNVGLSPGGQSMMGGHGSPYGFHGRSPNPHMVQHGGPPPPHPAMMGGHHPSHGPHHGMMPGGPHTHMGSPIHPHHPLPHNSQQQAQQVSQQQQQQPVQGQQNPLGEKEVTQVSSMPLPPSQYVDLYTDEAVARGTAPAPPPPITDAYTMFGNPFSADDKILQSLESQGIRRLYSNKDVDRKKELHKLNHSILVNFLDLLDILIRAPDSSKREEKIEDINLLFIHMHHLINEFRPHQARETLRVMLHVQMRKRMQIAEKFQKHLDEVQETIENALSSLPEQEESLTTHPTSKASKDQADSQDSSSDDKLIEANAINPVDTLLIMKLDEAVMSQQ